MASSYIVWYLFLAGIGSGAFLIAGVVDLILRRWDSEALEEFSCVSDKGLLIGPIAVALGSVFLVFDLGIPSRALNIFFSGQLTLLSFGSWVIVLFIGCAMGALIAGRLFSGRVSAIIEAVLHVLAVILSACVMVYSGLYLSAYSSVPFLHSPFVPLLFIASALSSGLAFLGVAFLFTRPFSEPFYGARSFIRIDAPLVAVETVLIAAFMVLSIAQGEEVGVSAEMLLIGDLKVLFWVGVVAAGLVMPLVAEVASLKFSNYPVLAIGGCGSLVGSLCLRYSLLLAAVRFSLVGMTPMPFWWG